MQIGQAKDLSNNSIGSPPDRWQTQIVAGAFLLVMIALFLTPCRAQTPTAQLTGLVTDPSGAVVPGAQVQVTNVDTEVQWETATTSSGYYTQTELPPGHYSITIRKQGFMTSNRTGITLAVSQVARIDFTLKLGAATQTVSVTAAAPLLQSQTASLGQVVQTQRINNLPLNGRNYLQLAKLTAGVAEPAPGDVGARGGSFTANGVRPADSNFSLDGVDNNCRIVDIQNNSYEVVQPPVDAIQEFKMETANYSAEYGYSAGAVVNATLKSGTNHVHGDVYEFIRNDHLDARNFFQPSNTPKPRFQRNQFGATLGGPLIRNKLFLFGSYERTTQNLAETFTTTLPSDAMRQGNFQGLNTIYDPATTQASGTGYIRDPFPNNTIPSTRIDPVAAKLVAILPEPNVPGQSFNNYISNPLQTDRVNRWDARGDVNISNTDKLFLETNISHELFVNPGPLPPPLIGNTSNNQNSHTTRPFNVALGETHIFSPTVVNEFRTGYSRIYDERGDQVSGPFLGSQFGFTGIPDNPGTGISGLPHIGISGFSNLGETSYIPNGKIAEVYQTKDSVSWSRGKHLFQAGGTFEWVRSFFDLSSSARGSFSFNGTFTQDPQSRPGTGSAFADFLLGIPSDATLSRTRVGDVRQRYYGLYFQDSWKITPKLTVNAGLRYGIWTPRVEHHDEQATFDPAQQKMLYPFNKVPAGIPASIVGTISSGVGQRSLVTTAYNNWGPRLGIAYHLAHNTVLRAGAGTFFAGPQFPGVGATPPGNPPFLPTSNYPTDQIHPNVTFASGFPSDALNVSAINPASSAWDAFDPNFPWARVDKWSFGIQEQVKGWLFETDYVGDKGTHLPVHFNLNNPYPGAGSVASRRPYQGFGNISFDTPMGNSSYNALQTQMKHTFSHSFTLVAAYTYSKVIDVGGTQLGGGFGAYRDVRNIFWERGPGQFDMRHRFVVSYMYMLPVGRGKRFAISNPVVDGFLGGWRVNGITTIRGGQPFTPSMSFSTANTGSGRPDRTCSGNLSNWTLAQYFDTSCFGPATAYNFGNSGRNILYGPGAVNFDFSVFKDFPVRKLGESGDIQFRGEFFNLFNHPQFSSPNSNVSTPQAGTITGLTSSMREVQFALKVVF